MKNPFKTTSTKVIYQNPWIKVREDGIVGPDGLDGVFGVVEMKNGSTILALDSAMNVLLVREYKYAISSASLELVSGGIDANETPLEAARRELLEETGATSDDWVPLGRLDPFTSVVNSANYMFMARSVLFPEIHSTLIDEPLERVVLPFNEVLDRVMKSEITHGASCAAVLKAAQYLANRT